MKPLMTIAIPTFHNFKQLGDCLRSLILYTDFPYQIVVVNNCPEDDETLEKMVRERSPIGDKLSIINMGRNAGWMGAINRALQECDTQYFTMLNDDVVFLPDTPTFWRLLVAGLEASNVAAVGPCSNFVAGTQSLMALDVPGAFETSLLIGFCMVCNTKILKEVGGLDESLPGGDDLDLSIRLRQHGKRLVVCRSAYVHHHGQQTGRRIKGENWDSLESQEKTNNALIKKHGVGVWYETFQASWRLLDETAAEQKEANELDWLSDKLKVFRGCSAKGLNLGCGSMKLAWDDISITNVDRDGPGDRGVGGQKFSDNCADIVCDATELKFCADTSQNFVIANHLLEHIVDMLGALYEWNRVLENDGELFIAVPDQDRVQSLLLDCTHVHALTKTSLERLLVSAGFKVLEMDTKGWGAIVCHARKVSGNVSG